MKKVLIDLLVCPDCQGDLSLSIAEGSEENIIKGNFKCRVCSQTHNIRNDIPFFASTVSHSGIKNQQVTYSHWWDDYHNEDTITDPIHRDFFYNSLRIKASEFQDKIVLDAGCGNGRFSYVVSDYRPKLLVCFDISSGLNYAKKIIEKNKPDTQVAFVQGDVTKPPFKKEVFDVLFIWGVMHHTPNTKKTFEVLAKRVKPAGRMGIYVYEYHPLYNYETQALSLIAYLRSLLLIRPMRFICSRLPAFLVRMLFQPIYYVERILNLGVMGCHGSGKEKWDKERYFRVVIDRFKSRYATEHQLEEVVKWFYDQGFTSLRSGYAPKVSLSGVKTNQNESSNLVLDIAYAEQKDETVNNYLSAENLKKTE